MSVRSIAADAPLVARYRRQMSFGAVGLGVMAVGFAVLFALVHGLGISPHVAYLVQAIVSVELSFVLSRYWTWSDRRGHTRALMWQEWRRFHVSRVVSVPANQGLFSLLVVGGAGVWTANAVCIGLTSVVNYLVGHHVVFGPDDA